MHYQQLLTNLATEHIIWKAKWHKIHYPHLFSENCTYMVLIGLYQSVPYMLVWVLRQFNLRQDLFDFTITDADIHKLDYKTRHSVWS